jgi:hypothetical protein
MPLSAFDIASHKTDGPSQEVTEIVEIVRLLPPMTTNERFELRKQLFDWIQVRRIG